MSGAGLNLPDAVAVIGGGELGLCADVERPLVGEGRKIARTARSSEHRLPGRNLRSL